jgi:methyl-accepting chemotaxis protein
MGVPEQMESIADSVIRLGEQSRAIGEIIMSVSDIADQSNLLSVNAAIEAANAGEHGKGFTVVAQVKNLAEQSKQATAQVRTI